MTRPRSLDSSRRSTAGFHAVILTTATPGPRARVVFNIVAPEEIFARHGPPVPPKPTFQDWSSSSTVERLDDRATREAARAGPREGKLIAFTWNTQNGTWNASSSIAIVPSRQTTSMPVLPPRLPGWVIYTSSFWRIDESHCHHPCPPRFWNLSAFFRNEEEHTGYHHFSPYHFPTYSTIYLLPLMGGGAVFSGPLHWHRPVAWRTAPIRQWVQTRPVQKISQPTTSML